VFPPERFVSKPESDILINGNIILGGTTGVFGLIGETGDLVARSRINGDNGSGDPVLTNDAGHTTQGTKTIGSPKCNNSQLGGNDTAPP